VKDGVRFRLARKLDTADPRAVNEFMEQFRPTIPVDRALLCMDCESIFEAVGDQRCPSCGSTVAWSVGRSLNRPVAARKAAI
jgi:hypothetical protein